MADIVLPPFIRGTILPARQSDGRGWVNAEGQLRAQYQRQHCRNKICRISNFQV